MYGRGWACAGPSLLPCGRMPGGRESMRGCAPACPCMGLRPVGLRGTASERREAVVNLCGDVVRAVRAWVCDGRGVFCGPVKCAGRFETYAWVWVELLVHGFATGWAAGDGRFGVDVGPKPMRRGARCCPCMGLRSVGLGNTARVGCRMVGNLCVGAGQAVRAEIWGRRCAPAELFPKDWGSAIYARRCTWPPVHRFATVAGCLVGRLVYRTV